MVPGVIKYILEYRGVLVTPGSPLYIRKPPGTLPVSEHSHPIYRSLRLDHFETPRHVRDHIRDSVTTSDTSKHINS